MPEVEVLPIGRHVLLHNLVSGAMVLASPSSVKALENPEPADADSQALRRLWKGAGLFEGARPRLETSLALTDAARPNLLFRGPGGIFAVSLPAGDPLADQLNTILSRQQYTNSEEELPHTAQVCRVEVAGETYSAFEGGQPSSGDMTRDDARFYIIRRVAETICASNHHVALVCHASAVAQKGRSLILLGTSGRGKTTTALGLLEAGCQQVADDHVPIGLDGTSALGFPGAIALKSGTWSLPEAQPFLKSSTLPQVRDGSRYVTAPYAVDTGDRLPVAALVFPNYDPDHDPDVAPNMVRMQPEEVLVAAVQAGARIAPGSRTAGPLATMCNTIPAWHLTYASSQQSVPACLSLLNS